INFDTLQAIDFLNFVEQVFLELLRSTDIENLVWNDRPLCELLALLHEIALEDNDVLGEGNEMLLLGAGVWVCNNHAALTADGPTDIDNPIDFGNLGRILRATSFKQLRHAGQTAGNVFCLGDLARRSRQASAGRHFLRLFDLDVCSCWDRIASENLLLLANNDDLRMQVLLVLDDDGSHDAGGLIDFLANRHTLNHIAEFDPA